MLATLSSARTSIGRGCNERVPFSLPAIITGISVVVVVVSIVKFNADVFTSVFLCALLLLSALLLVDTFLSLTLTLTGLARRNRLGSLVGLLTKRATRTVEGE